MKDNYNAIEKLLDKYNISESQADSIGYALPTGLEKSGKERSDAYHNYINYMTKDMKFDKQDAIEFYKLNVI